MPAQTILIVDDDDDVREILAETLEEFGYRVIRAGSGEEALQCLDRQDGPDMIITDVRMPGMSGLELAQKVRARDERSLPLVTPLCLTPHWVMCASRAHV